MRAVVFAISMLLLQGCAATHASAPVAPATLSRPDPTVTDPENYKVILENDRVRVLRYHDVPGTKTHLHHHPASVLYALSTFERRLTFGDGTSQERVLHEGDVMWLPAQDHPGREHRNDADGRAARRAQGPLIPSGPLRAVARRARRPRRNAIARARTRRCQRTGTAQ